MTTILRSMGIVALMLTAFFGVYADTAYAQTTGGSPVAPAVATEFNLRVCNKSTHPVIYAAVATRDNERNTTIRGWWKIKSGECADIGTYRYLESRTDHSGFFYIYVKDETGAPLFARVDDATLGVMGHCVADEEFSRVVPSFGDDTCEASTQRAQFRKYEFRNRSDVQLPIR